MNLEHAFTVPAAIDDVWVALSDTSTIGECLPDADMAESDAMSCRGSITVDHVAYKGAIRAEDSDDAAHSVTLRGLGQEQGGETLARASATLTLEPEGDATRVDVALEVTAEGGEVATIGGTPEQVAQAIIDAFADALRAKVGEVEQEETAVEAGLPVEAAADAEEAERPEDPPPPERMSPMDEVALMQASQDDEADDDIARAQETAGDEPDGPVEVAEEPQLAPVPEPEPVAEEEAAEAEPVPMEPEPEPEPEPVHDPEPVAQELEPEPEPDAPAVERAEPAAPSEGRTGSIPPPGWQPD